MRLRSCSDVRGNATLDAQLQHASRGLTLSLVLSTSVGGGQGACMASGHLAHGHGSLTHGGPAPFASTAIAEAVPMAIPSQPQLASHAHLNVSSLFACAPAKPLLNVAPSSEPASVSSCSSRNLGPAQLMEPWSRYSDFVCEATPGITPACVPAVGQRSFGLASSLDGMYKHCGMGATLPSSTAHPASLLKTPFTGASTGCHSSTVHPRHEYIAYPASGRVSFLPGVGEATAVELANQQQHDSAWASREAVFAKSTLSTTVPCCPSAVATADNADPAGALSAQDNCPAETLLSGWAAASSELHLEEHLDGDLSGDLLDFFNFSDVGTVQIEVAADGHPAPAPPSAPASPPSPPNQLATAATSMSSTSTETPDLFAAVSMPGISSAGVLRAKDLSVKWLPNTVSFTHVLLERLWTWCS